MSLGADARCTFNSSGKVPPGVFEGKKLAYQIKWSLETRSWSEAQSRLKALQKRLKNFAKGKVAPKSRTVAAALQEWYKFRDQNKLGNTKAKQMGGKLDEWCEKNDILLLTAFTTEKAMKWRVTLPHRSGESSSLSVHWSFRGLRGWATLRKLQCRTPRQIHSFALATRRQRLSRQLKSRSRKS